MIENTKKLKVIENCSPENIPFDDLRCSEPLIFKGLVKDWPITKAGKISEKSASDYLLKFYQNIPVNASIGKPETNGRVFYNNDYTDFNYQSSKVNLQIVLKKLLQHLTDSQPPSIYMASTSVDHWFNGFRAENDIQVPSEKPTVNLWMGNRISIPAHYDLPDNLACVVVGKRRFTLFPPNQIQNLYPGPLDWAPGGQAISLVDFSNPDFNAHPNFKYALKEAAVVELEAGDALFIPSMWWHQVDSLTPFNGLINYWWRQSPEFMQTPMNALYHSLLTIQDLPAEQKQAWQDIFEYYVFDTDGKAAAHIPEHCRGFLDPLDEKLARQLRALLLNRLNR